MGKVHAVGDGDTNESGRMTEPSGGALQSAPIGQPSSQSQGVSVAPPTVRGALPPRRPSWPTVIGIICLILGGMGVAQSALALVAPLLFMQWIGAFGPHNAAMPPTAYSSVAAFALSLANLLIPMVLMAGGIQLLRWRRSAITLLRIYAVATIVVALCGTAWLVLHATSSVHSATDDAASAAFSEMMIIAGAVFGCGFAMILPVFLLVWFARAKIRSEVGRFMTTGRARAR